VLAGVLLGLVLIAIFYAVHRWSTGRVAAAE